MAHIAAFQFNPAMVSFVVNALEAQKKADTRATNECAIAGLIEQSAT
jgi:desulfoferrodoxin (superoxide reductase-like protein)